MAGFCFYHVILNRKALLNYCSIGTAIPVIAVGFVAIFKNALEFEPSPIFFATLTPGIYGCE